MRSRSTAPGAKLLADIDAELRTIHLDRSSVLDQLLPAFRELLDTELFLVVTPIERSQGGLVLDRFHVSGIADPSRLRYRFSEFFKNAPQRYAWFDAVRPEPEQRNRVLDALDLMSQAEYEQSAIYHKVMLPMGLHGHRQPRVLLCEGPSLLAWFGTFHPMRATRRQRNLLRTLARRVHRRLLIERRLDRAPRSFAALETCLDRIGSPAFVLGKGGAILEANQAGRALLDTRAVEARASLRDCLRGRPSVLPFELTRLDEQAAPDSWLAILPATSRGDRIRAAVDRASSRWALTPRQRDVLGHVVDGRANVTIAAYLRVTVRAIELQVTVLLERASVDSRSALVASVLLDG